MSLTFEAQVRPEGSKPGALRREGLIPANLYGHDGANSVLLTINARDLGYMLRSVKVGETPVELTIADLNWKGSVVLQEVQKHPWKSAMVYHVSFLAAKG
ncbi:MAG: 50S ribosomal protein L25 [Limnothrix sp. CACIAM 69d]|jgi:large subunit ribosomal protein L25|nr:MAG: 50S ribosomal protein L25 [Limnothrix sp. CACIAM 69d]